MSPVGQQRKSSVSLGMSASGGKAEVDFGLLEVRKSTLYWEGEDDDGEGDDEFTADEKGEADLAWIAYIVAEK